MKRETIKYTIRQDGNVTEEVVNVPGSACVDLTSDIEIKLGELENKVYTADYYQQPNLNQDVTLQYDKNQT
mgnify:FL=1|tara:strand:- start:415 stop:627 length:213 start_codon:yes stop_codon:yes gene_type:complete